MNLNRFIHRPKRGNLPPTAVRMSKSLLMRSEAVWRGELHHKQTVWLLSGKQRCKIISLRQEFVDHSWHEHPQPFCYRANVWDTVAKVMRFVDLVPGQLLEVR